MSVVSSDSLEELRDGPAYQNIYYACKYGFTAEGVGVILEWFYSALSQKQIQGRPVTLFSELEYDDENHAFCAMVPVKSAETVIEVLVEVTDRLIMVESDDFDGNLVLKSDSTRIWLLDKENPNRVASQGDERFPVDIRFYRSRKEWFSVIPDMEMKQAITEEVQHRIMQATGTMLVEDLQEQRVFIAGRAEVQTDLAFKKLENVEKFWLQRLEEQELANRHLFYAEKVANFQVCVRLFPAVEKLVETTLIDPAFVKDVDKAYGLQAKRCTIRCCRRLLSQPGQAGTAPIYLLNTDKKIKPVIKEHDKKKPHTAYVYAKKGNWVGPDSSFMAKKVDVNLLGAEPTNTSEPYPTVDVSSWNMGVELGDENGMTGMSPVDEYGKLSLDEKLNLARHGSVSALPPASSYGVPSRVLAESSFANHAGSSRGNQAFGRATSMSVYGSAMKESALLKNAPVSNIDKENTPPSGNSALTVAKKRIDIGEDIYTAHDLKDIPGRGKGKSKAVAAASQLIEAPGPTVNRPTTAGLKQVAPPTASGNNFGHAQRSSSLYPNYAPGSVHSFEYLASIKPKSLESSDITGVNFDTFVHQKPTDNLQQPSVTVHDKPNPAEKNLKTLAAFNNGQKPADKFQKPSIAANYHRGLAEELSKASGAVNNHQKAADNLQNSSVAVNNHQKPADKNQMASVSEAAAASEEKSNYWDSASWEEKFKHWQLKEAERKGKEAEHEVKCKTENEAFYSTPKPADKSQKALVAVNNHQKPAAKMNPNFLIDLDGGDFPEQGNPGSAKELAGLSIEVITGEDLDLCFGGQSSNVSSAAINRPNSGFLIDNLMEDEVQTRAFHSTMKQKAPAPAKKQKAPLMMPGAPALEAKLPIPSWDPSVDFLGDMERGLQPLLRQMKNWSGSLTLRAELGRFIISNKFGPNMIYTDADYNSFDPSTIANALAHNTVGLTKVITTLPAEAEYVREMSDEKGERMWDRSPKAWPQTRFVFACKDKESGTRFEVVMDGETHKFEVLSSQYTFGTVNVHAVLRAWDYRIIGHGSELMGEKYKSWAKDLVKSIAVPADRANLEMTFDVANAHEIEVVGLRVRQESDHLSKNGNSTLHIDHIEDMYLRHTPNKDDSKTLYWVKSYDEETNPPKTFTRSWFEFSVSSVRANKALRENKNLEVGEVAGWEYQTLLEEGMIWSLCHPISQILKKSDGLGYWNIEARPDIEVPAAGPSLDWY